MTKEFYDRYWKHALPPMAFFDHEPVWNEKTFQHHEKMIWPWLKNGKILDLGCGEGHLTKRLNRVDVCYGTDISPEALKKARRNHPDVIFIDYLHHKSNRIPRCLLFNFIY